MKTTEQMIKQKIEAYTNAGYSFNGAVRQVKALTLGRFDAAIERVVTEMNQTGVVK